MKRISILILSGLISINYLMASVKYTVSFDQSKAHYAHISVHFEASEAESIFKVPVWTPGSYKVREFSQNVEHMKATVNGLGMEVDRIDKNTWSVGTETGQAVTFEYDVYCFVNSVRHSYVDEYYAFLHGVSAFGYVVGQQDEEVILELMPLSNWANVEIAAERLKANGHVFRLDNYDLLADSPIALGNFDVVEYVSGDVPHRVVMMGEGNYDLEVIKTDFKKISDEEVKMFKHHPSKLYVHFIQNTEVASGGLEHMNSQTSQMDRWGYNNKERYIKFLGLVSHEYFHLWNVKRIRPVELGPFDYDKENYTDMLWIAEGITSYYDDLFLFRAGFYTETEYFDVLSKQINRFENTPGKDEMTLEQSSKLAWIKAYLPNENSHNTTISYYNKGMLVAWMLDLQILKNSKGKRGLDDVMRKLYSNYQADPSKGFTHSEFIAVCSEIAGENMQSFFDAMVFSTSTIDYSRWLADFGMAAEEVESEEKAWSGVSSSLKNGKLIIDKVFSNGPAEEAGIAVNDELIAINGWRVTHAMNQHAKKFDVGDTITILLSRDGRLIEKEVTFIANPRETYKVKSTNKNKLQECWLSQD
ncbi:MAG: M61 family metallopeptidase [Bacteroidia bacterium]